MTWNRPLVAKMANLTGRLGHNKNLTAYAYPNAVDDAA